MKHIRNFSIIAHIDHGKSTLADRFLEITGALSQREMDEQVLDSMDLERERGITIKAHSVRLDYRAEDGILYTLNLIDTPGHVDFGYEVSRSLAGCEGAILVVDASQGVEAQTLANAYLAIENNLSVIPVINKIDLPSAEPEEVKRQIRGIAGLNVSETLRASAKEGKGIKEILEAVVQRIPPPKGKEEGPLRALIFDSWFDDYKGVVVLVRVFDGFVTEGQKIKVMATGKVFEVKSVGVFTPKMVTKQRLSAGEVGYIIAGIRKVTDTKIGDTITDADVPSSSPLPGYREVKPMVFCGLYPTEPIQYEGLRDALEKLRLNDSSFTYVPETSLALGFGFRCGFLGLLHMEIIQERLEREFNLSLLATAPNVAYRVVRTDEAIVMVENPAKLPETQKILNIEEPFILATIITPTEFVGPIIQLCQDRRGLQKGFVSSGKERMIITYEIPLNEIVMDFYNRLKSLSRGYASMDYEFVGFRKADLVRLDILLNGEIVDALSCIIHIERSQIRGRQIAQRLKEIIPRQLFEVAIQAAIGSKIIARETVSPLRKNVTAKCYGGDITRKRKLREKQKEGKKRMKQIGRVDIPQEAFLSLLKVEA
ncbi:MAG: translation elongation factor 4 [Nitrospirota bacterium]